MSLNWNLTAIDDWESKDRHLIDTMIWMTLSVGISDITEKNKEKFFDRTRRFEEIAGPLLHTKDEDGNVKPRPITFRDVCDFIGLKTNSNTMTETQFKKRLKRIEKDAK